MGFQFLDKDNTLSIFLMKYGIGRSIRQSNLIVMVICVGLIIFGLFHANYRSTSVISKEELNAEMQQMDSPSTGK
jgi:hypothetical protein